MATSGELSELSFSPRSTYAALKGHESPSQEQLLHIAQGLAGVVQKNTEVTRSNNEQLEVLWQQAENLAKCEVNAAHLEETYKHCVMVWLAHMPENHRGMHGDLMMGSGGLPEGRLEGVSPRMEAGEPLEGRSNSNNKVSMSHGHSRQDLDYLACWPIPAQSTQCKDKSSAQEAAQQSLDASVCLMIVHD